jgi:hypothetical protein
MILRRSRFTHVIALGGGRVLILHAVTQLRLAVDGEVEWLLGCFDQPRSLPEDFPDLSRVVGYDVPTPRGLCRRAAGARLSQREDRGRRGRRDRLAIARDRGARSRRDAGPLPAERGEGAASYWAASATRSLGDLAMQRRRLDVALLADCDLQMEAEFLKLEGRAHGLDLHIGATFPGDVR